MLLMEYELISEYECSRRSQYFIDSFESIRNSLTLVHTPLKIAYNDVLKISEKELSLANSNILPLNCYLTRLMDLKQLFANTEKLNSSEYELGAFSQKQNYFF